MSYYYINNTWLLRMFHSVIDTRLLTGSGGSQLIAFQLSEFLPSHDNWGTLGLTGNYIQMDL